jgi:acetyltransferase-like isoleucine patch superfamily enzyme
MNWSEKLNEALSGLRRDPLEVLRLARMGFATARFRYLMRVAGPGCVFGTNNRVINAANVTIGRGCLFQDSIYIRAGVNGRVSIGDRVALNSFVQLYGHGGISLGDETQIGPGTIITTTGHDYTERNLEAHFKPIIIGKRVWVGANATIIGGVTIGDCAVIGAGAVVIRDIPAHSVAVGVPARVVRQLTSAREAADCSGGRERAVHEAESGPAPLRRTPRQAAFATTLMDTAAESEDSTTTRH